MNNHHNQVAQDEVKEKGDLVGLEILNIEVDLRAKEIQQSEHGIRDEQSLIHGIQWSIRDRERHIYHSLLQERLYTDNMKEKVQQLESIRTIELALIYSLPDSIKVIYIYKK